MGQEEDFDICVSFLMAGDRNSTYSKLFFPVCELENIGIIGDDYI